MKTREELTETFNTCSAADYYRDRAIFEVLLDIRDLLTAKPKGINPNVNITVNKSSSDDASAIYGALRREVEVDFKRK